MQTFAWKKFDFYLSAVYGRLNHISADNRDGNTGRCDQMLTVNGYVTTLAAISNTVNASCHCKDT